MVNPFLSSKNYDTETAIMLERAYIHDIGNAVAYTDGDRVFLNTPDNLFKILPAYDDNMLKWLLWHERMHMELKHHNRFFKYVSELKEEDLEDEFHVTQNEVNIIMDILVHDWMANKFPELVETAVNNLAQMRDRNALSYTFETFTLEEMLDEYSKHKHGEDEDKGSDGEGDGEEDKSEDKSEGKGEGTGDKKSEDKTKDSKSGKTKTKEKGHSAGGHDSSKEKSGEDTSEIKSEQPADPGHHDETDWSKLDDIDIKEFITKEESENYIKEIDKLKRTKIRLARISKTLNGLVTSTKVRSYKTPSYTMTGQHTIFKGSKSGKASLYLCFDASGSMGGDMDTFKDIISQAIPQAMNTPTTWFSGWAYSSTGRDIMKRCIDKDGRDDDYYKSTFKDFMNIMADSGYDDDGDRTIELCWRAEQEGYSPIGVTDGGGRLSWSKDLLKQLKRTVLVGHNKTWLSQVKEVNPNIQIIYTGRDGDI